MSPTLCQLSRVAWATEWLTKLPIGPSSDTIVVVAWVRRIRLASSHIHPPISRMIDWKNCDYFPTYCSCCSASAWLDVAPLLPPPLQMLRNHASLLFWCGGNELFPETLSPPPKVAAALASMVKDLDGTRPYLPSSMSNYTHYRAEYALAPKDGPYGHLHLFQFYQRNPGECPGLIGVCNREIIGEANEMKFSMAE